MMNGSQERIVPRLMRKDEAAAYCAVTPSRLSQLVRAGTLPGPVPGTTRFDRVAIDRALDKLSGIEPTKELSAYEQWRLEHDRDDKRRR